MKVLALIVESYTRKKEDTYICMYVDSMAKKTKKRCSWVPLEKEFYVKYHDEEWGVQVRNDNTIFEFLVLESAQAGLSWETILKRRKGYKKAFSNFDPKKVSQLNKRDVARLLKDEGIIRNRAKIEATINNAQRFLEIQKEFKTFSNYAWGFVGGEQIVNKRHRLSDYPKFTKEAEVWSKDLKGRGFKFLGPTTLYAHMQATGMVNDHTVDCFRYKEVM